MSDNLLDIPDSPEPELARARRTENARRDAHEAANGALSFEQYQHSDEYQAWQRACRQLAACEARAMRSTP